MPIHRFLGPLILILAAPMVNQLHAQRFGLGAHVGYVTLSGDDFEGIEGGRAFQGNAWYRLNDKFQLGVGAVRSSHDIDIVDDNIINWFLYAEPRMIFPAPGTRLTPFLGIRLGVARQSIEIEGIDVKASGTGYGALGGLDVQIGPTAALEFAVTLTHFSLGDFSVDGQDIEDTDTSGNALGVQMGIVFWFGGGR